MLTLILFFVLLYFLLLILHIRINLIHKLQKNLKTKFKIIGITGLKRNGKDTIANHLCQKYKYTRIAFADPLKNACAVLFGFNDEQLYGSLKEIPDKYWFGLTPRHVLQFIGTEIFRKNMNLLHPNFGEDFWLLCANKKINDILDKNGYVVVSDVRFPNEYQMIKKLGGIVIRVNRPSINTCIDLHDSERFIPTLEVDYELINDGSIKELNKKVDLIIKVN